MIASSVFVLTALTMTGMYMQSREQFSEFFLFEFAVSEADVSPSCPEGFNPVELPDPSDSFVSYDRSHGGNCGDGLCRGKGYQGI